jgi:hypothetical protein
LWVKTTYPNQLDYAEAVLIATPGEAKKAKG